MFPTLDQFMGQFEGFGTPGTIATRQNNPGDLAYGPFAISQGATGPGANNIAVFPNSEAGYSAMDSLIQEYAAKGYNIGDLISAWAPPNAPGNTPQSTQNYTNFVANKTGTTPGTPVSALQSGNDALAKAGSILGNILGTVAGGGNPAAGAAGSVQGGLTGQAVQTMLSGWSFSRIAAIIVGVVCIAGAIFLFKPVNNVVVGSVKKGAIALAA